MQYDLNYVISALADVHVTSTSYRFIELDWIAIITAVMKLNFCMLPKVAKSVW